MSRFHVTTVSLGHFTKRQDQQKLVADHLNGPEQDGYELLSTTFHQMAAPPYWTFIWQRRDDRQAEPSRS